MSFEKYISYNKSTITPYVSITRYGLLSFNRPAREKYKLSDFKYCVLYYDKKKNKIGIELTNDEAEGALMLRKIKDPKYSNVGVIVTIKGLHKKYGIKLDKTHTFKIEIDSGGMLVIDLNNEN